MSDLFLTLRDLLMAQRDSPDLVAIPAGLLDRADKELTDLKQQYRESGSQRVKERHESILCALDDLQECRAEIIWAMAYHQAEDRRGLTDSERFIFDILSDNAAKLRGL